MKRYTVIGSQNRTQQLGRKAGSTINRCVFVVDNETGSEYAVYSTNNQGTVMPILMNKEHYAVDGPSIFVGANGYAYLHTENSNVTHHSTIVGAPPLGHTIDHINRIKTDNRLGNLRFATHAQQAENMGFRSDKHAPPTELQALGIKNMPSGMRWDSSEMKFVNDVYSISGTKSSKVSFVNKFRDATQKVLNCIEQKHTTEIQEFVDRRIKLANEYHQIVQAAHEAYPENIPNGPFVDLDELQSELQHCRDCLDRLPKVAQGEVLHGPLNIAQTIVDFPSVDAIGIVKTSNDNDVHVLIADAVFKEIFIKFPAVDLSDSSPIVSASFALQSIFPKIITDGDVKRKKKYLIKDLVWEGLLGKLKPANHTIVPLNYQQFDVRADNLVCLPGGPKTYKSPETIPEIPTEFELDMCFWPRGVSVYYSGGGSVGSPWVLNVKIDGTHKRFTCGPTTIKHVFESRVLPLLRCDPNFNEVNFTYQKMLQTFCGIQKHITTL